VRLGVRFLDNVVDATPYFFPENQAQQQRERRIGLGTLGLGELLIRLGRRYGSPESVTFCDTLFQRIAHWAYQASCALAAEKGAFPAWNPAIVDTDAFVARMAQRFPDLDAALRAHGMRNVTVLTQAPTGTVGTMVATWTGIEPFYALAYTRQSRLGVATEHVTVAQDWLATHPGEPLPAYFVGALGLTPEEHIRVQAAIQRWTDSSISKTANGPAAYTVADTARLYELAYHLGCKGVTVYRDQSRQEQVLATPATPDTSLAVADRPPVQPVPAVITGTTYRKETPAGTVRVVINAQDGDPFEVFLLLGRAGSEVQSFTEALGRVISLFLRTDGRVPPRERLALVAEQLQGLGGAHQIGFGPGRVLSAVDGIGQVLAQHLAGQAAPNPPAADPPPAARPGTGGDLCPQCGAPGLVRAEGCAHCTACGFSKC
jgi:ribonucleoside-diphosphate reductase alpha chain